MAAVATQPVQIVVREAQGYLSGVPPEVVEKLQEATSFRPVGYQYTQAFKRGRTNGYIKLIRHSKFPAGLLARVVGTLKKEGVPYVLDIEQGVAHKPDIQLRVVGVEERPYQTLAVEKALLNPRGVIRAPTGSGKTAIGARIIAMRGKHAIVVVPTIDLLHQYRRFLMQHLRWVDPPGEIDIGQLGDGVVNPAPVTVATARTAARALGVAYESYEYGEYDDKDDTEVDRAMLRGWVEAIGTLIVDEAHILGAQTIYDLAVATPAPNKYGMSASPWRDDGADLMIEAATGPVIYRIGTDELVKDGWLVPPIIQVVNTQTWWTPAAWGQTCMRCGQQRPRNRYGPPVTKCLNCGSEKWRSEYTDAYRVEIVENDVRNAAVAAMVQKLPGPHLVLVKQIKHGRTLQQLIPDSVFLSGKDAGEVRVGVYDGVREGTIRTVVATTIADLGLDLPILRTLVLAAGGKSSVRHLQRIGRVARPCEGKTSALVVDFNDGHIHRWFREHQVARRKIEHEEWKTTALWV